MPDTMPSALWVDASMTGPPLSPKIAGSSAKYAVGVSSARTPGRPRVWSSTENPTPYPDKRRMSPMLVSVETVDPVGPPQFRTDELTSP